MALDRKIAYIDLTTGEIEIKPIPLEIRKKFIGGRGLDAYLLYNHTKKGCDPLGPGNALIISGGILTATSTAGIQRGLFWARVLSINIAVVALVLSIGASTVAAQDAEPQVDPVIAQIDAFIAKNPVDKSKARWRTRLRKPPTFKFDPAKTYTWKLDTNLGEIRFRLFDDSRAVEAITGTQSLTVKDWGFNVSVG